MGGRRRRCLGGEMEQDVTWEVGRVCLKGRRGLDAGRDANVEEEVGARPRWRGGVSERPGWGYEGTPGWVVSCMGAR